MATLYVLVALTAIYGLLRQTKDNSRAVKSIRRAIEKAAASPDYHPILVMRYHEHEAFVQGIRLVEQSPDTEFWLVTDTLDPSINLNYFIYPKRLYMNPRTQFALYEFLMDKVNHPPEIHLPPRQWDKVLVVKSQSAELRSEWTGSR
ncbi:MAG: hypothetical protein Kow0059_09010 [Candidatus Sumerlaeia bacterium]